MADYTCVKCWQPIHEEGRSGSLGICRPCTRRLILGAVEGFMLKAGDKIEHDNFGAGTVLNAVSNRVTVKFDSRPAPLLLDAEVLEHHSTVVHGSQAAPAVTSGGPQPPVVRYHDALCRCGKPQGHRGRCPGIPLKVKATETQTTIERSLTVERQPRNGHPRNPSALKLIDQKLSEALAAMRQEIEALKTKRAEAESEPFAFWPEEADVREASLCTEKTAKLFGATVPEALLDAIWFSMTARSKARLLNAIEVARYKVRPGGEVSG